MTKWKECKLDDIAIINPSEKLAKGTNAKKVAMELLQPYTKRIPSYSIEEYKGGTKFKNGDTLLARITPCLENGKTAFVDIFDEDEIGFGSTEYIILREREGVSEKHFLYYFACSPAFREVAIKSMTGSSGRQRVQTDVVRDHVFLLPPLSEQKTIASVLSSLDDKIDLLHRQNKTLEAMAETLFRQWFIEEAKEDWEEKTLGEMLTITSSKRIFYSEYVSSGIPFYRSKEIIELSKSGSTNSELYITDERFSEIVMKHGAPMEGDILLTSVGTLGVAYRVNKNDKFYFKDGNLTWFKDFNGISNVIIYCWLKSSFGKQQLDAIAIGSTQAALTIRGLKGISILIPPDDILEYLEKQITQIYAKVEANQKQFKTLEKMRDTLLPELMNGEVRVKFDE